jgi:hypothetical protein
MTARMDNNFINYVDFFDVAVEAFDTAPKQLFTKMMRMIIGTLHQQASEIEKQALLVDEMNRIPVNDLEEFYDMILDGIDDIKLLKVKLENIQKSDKLFLELLEELTRLHNSYILYMDRMGQLEVRILTENI